MFKRKKKDSDMVWYDCHPIDKLGCQWNILFGQRSNGKTQSLLTLILEHYHDTKKKGAYIRRFVDTILPTKHSDLFNSMTNQGVIKERFKDTKEQWTTAVYFKRKWFLAKYQETKNGERKPVRDTEPFMYSFAINEEESYKGLSFPDITTIFFDEFISRSGYLFDEFIKFNNLCSTIIRKRRDVKIWLVGNTINQYCPYFADMGIKHPENIPLGATRIYTYGKDSARKLVVQRTENAHRVDGKDDVDYYFAFDNPKLSMITKGDWEIDSYPHCPFYYLPKEVRYIYFIVFDEATYQCEIINHEGDWITFIHRKTTPIKDIKRELIFTPDVHTSVRYRPKINKPTDEVGSTIYSFFQNGKVFYQDNEVGDAIMNYLKWCSSLNG